MKPFRGKRIGPLSWLVEFNLPLRGVVECWDPFGPVPVAAAAGRCTFRRAVCHDRFVGGHKPPWKVALTSVGVLQPWVASARWRTEELLPAVPALRLGRPAFLHRLDW